MINGEYVTRSEDLAAHVRLWQAVLAELFRSGEILQLFFDPDQSDMELLCAYAGRDADYVRRKVREQGRELFRNLDRTAKRDDGNGAARRRRERYRAERMAAQEG